MKIALAPIFCWMVTTGFAQVQGFDHFTFTMPAGYVSKAGQTFIDYLKYNEARTAYAEITFYRARSASSDLQAEFTKEWNTVVKAKAGSAVPVPSPSETENGWVTTFGSAKITDQKGNYIQTLILFAGNNLVTSISVRVTDDSFAKEVEQVLGSVAVTAPELKPSPQKSPP